MEVIWWAISVGTGMDTSKGDANPATERRSGREGVSYEAVCLMVHGCYLLSLRRSVLSWKRSSGASLSLRLLYHLGVYSRGKSRRHFQALS